MSERNLDMIGPMEKVLAHIGECAGVEVGDVPALIEWADQYRVMKQQRDALLSALKDLLDREWQDDEGTPTLEKAREQAKAAIAAV